MIERVLTARITIPGAGQGQEVTQALSVGLLLDDGRVAWGDCAGGEPAPGYDEALATVQRAVAPALEGRQLAGFRPLAAELDVLTETVTVTRTRRLTAEESDTRSESGGRTGFSRRALLTAPARLFQPGGGDEEEPPTEQVAVKHRLHPAVRYGVSQALLQAVALVRGRTMAQVVGEEWGLAPPKAPVPIHARCDYEAHHQAEAAIRHQVASLPQAPIQDVAAQVGADGNRLTRYLRRLAERIAALGGDQYRPAIHLDLAGALGQIADHHSGHMLGHLYAWRMAAQPYPLRFEDPVLLADRQARIEALQTLHDYLRLRKIDVQLVAGRGIDTVDDLATFLAGTGSGDRPPVDAIHVRMPQFGSLHNTVEAVLACQRAGVGVLLGGSAAETDLAARVAVHVALATRPDLFLARPGRGVDVAVSMVRNEMARTLAVIASGEGHDRIRI